MGVFIPDLGVSQWFRAAHVGSNTAVKLELPAAFKARVNFGAVSSLGNTCPDRLFRRAGKLFELPHVVSVMACKTLWRTQMALAHKRLALETIPCASPTRKLSRRTSPTSYIVFGPLQWARVVSPFKLLAEDDPVYAWRKRLFDANDMNTAAVAREHAITVGIDTETKVSSRTLPRTSNRISVVIIVTKSVIKTNTP